MSVFDWLLIAHLAGDFLLQTDTMARLKMRQWSWLFRHIGWYMLVMTLVVAVYAWTHAVPGWLAAAGLLFIAVTHVILDRRSFTAAWMKFAGMSLDQRWLAIVVDQIFHLVTLAIVAQALAAGSG